MMLIFVWMKNTDFSADIRQNGLADKVIKKEGQRFFYLVLMVENI